MKKTPCITPQQCPGDQVSVADLPGPREPIMIQAWVPVPFAEHIRRLEFKGIDSAEREILQNLASDRRSKTQVGYLRSKSGGALIHPAQKSDDSHLQDDAQEHEIGFVMFKAFRAARDNRRVWKIGEVQDHIKKLRDDQNLLKQDTISALEYTADRLAKSAAAREQGATLLAEKLYAEAEHCGAEINRATTDIEIIEEIISNTMKPDDPMIVDRYLITRSNPFAKGVQLQIELAIKHSFGDYMPGVAKAFTEVVTGAKTCRNTSRNHRKRKLK